jgi:lipoprotein-anchoring transpeptidase ErfK/SrfK
MATSSLEHSGVPSRRRALPVIVGAAVALLVLLALAMYLYDRSQRDVIAHGVQVDGIQLGGLDAAAARVKLQRELVAKLQQPVVVSSGARQWTFDPRRAGVHADVNAVVAQAVAASREGSIFTRTFRGLFGGHVNRTIPVTASYSHAAVRGFVGEVRAAVDRPPRNAEVEPSSSGLRTVPSRTGVAVVASLLGQRIDRAMLGLDPGRNVHLPTHSTRPAITTRNLAAKYPAYIVVDRGTFQLRFYNHLKLEHTYEIAVGMEGLETPAGLHHIEWEQVNPPWYVPKKAWAGALAGTVVPPGPADPLKARFMSFEGGAGIHGIDPSEYSSIGHDASHGCVRMRIPDVIELYSKSPVGTPVYII